MGRKQRNRAERRREARAVGNKLPARSEPNAGPRSKKVGEQLRPGYMRWPFLGTGFLGAIRREVILEMPFEGLEWDERKADFEPSGEPQRIPYAPRVVWTCDHRHEGHKDATACAEQRLARAATGEPER